MFVSVKLIVNGTVKRLKGICCDEFTVIQCTLWMLHNNFVHVTKFRASNLPSAKYLFAYTSSIRPTGSCLH
jgi:hypothetical protein